MDLKATLKTIKLNEPTISTILGAIVLLAAALLLFNYFKARPPVGSITSTSTSTEESVKPGGKHTVAAGEHLWGIAEKYYGSGYNWVDIAETNSLVNADILSEGTELSIPDVPAKLATVEASAKQAQAPPISDNQQAISGDQYVVIQGDHLWNIAVRAYGDGYQWTKVWEANKANIPNPNLIYPSTKLTVPR